MAREITRPQQNTLYFLNLQIKKKGDVLQRTSPFALSIILAYCKNEIRTPAATAEPITPEMLLAMQ